MILLGLLHLKVVAVHSPRWRRGRTFGRRLLTQHELLVQRVGRHFRARTGTERATAILARVCDSVACTHVQYALPTFTGYLMKNKEPHRSTDCYSTERAMVGRGQIPTDRERSKQGRLSPSRSTLKALLLGERALGLGPWRRALSACCTLVTSDMGMGADMGSRDEKVLNLGPISDRIPDRPTK